MIWKLIRIFLKPMKRLQSIMTLTDTTINALELVALRLRYYNPLSQNSEHGGPTERKDREVDWSEVTRQDQMSDQYRKTAGRKERERMEGEWRYTDVTSMNRWSDVRQCHQPHIGGRVATWFKTCIAQGIERWEGKLFLKRGREWD